MPKLYPGTISETQVKANDGCECPRSLGALANEASSGLTGSMKVDAVSLAALFEAMGKDWQSTSKPGSAKRFRIVRHEL